MDVLKNIYDIIDSLDFISKKDCKKIPQIKDVEKEAGNILMKFSLQMVFTA